MSLLGEDAGVKYLVLGDEVGENGTPHVQGFVVFTRMWRFNRVKEALGGRCHLELARGTSKEASDYCKKDGKFTVYGECPQDTRLTSDGVSEANKSVWEAARKNAEMGLFENIPAHIYMRYKAAIHSIFDDHCHATECISVLDHIWIVGRTGIGKSRYCCGALS